MAPVSESIKYRLANGSVYLEYPASEAAVGTLRLCAVEFSKRIKDGTLNYLGD